MRPRLTCLFVLLVAPYLQAAVIFTDNFDTGASPLWLNNTGSWSASGGVYNAFEPFAVNRNELPFILTDFSIEVDINNVADGGIWLRISGGQGVLLVTGGAGWGHGDRSSVAGRMLYWHEVVAGTGAILNPVHNVFEPGVSDVHLRVDVIGNTYTAYLNGSVTPISTYTSSTFTSGAVALYDFSEQTFDNVVVSVPSPSVVPDSWATLPSLVTGLCCVTCLRWRAPKRC